MPGRVAGKPTVARGLFDFVEGSLGHHTHLFHVDFYDGDWCQKTP